ncbi:MAG: hypothetical protein ACLQPH_07790 [Acidimicrobiales bacterium]
MSERGAAEGWYEDPFRLHQHRWFSNGKPSKLVRDDGVESSDPAPGDVPPGPLVPVDSVAVAADGSDLKRADDAEANSSGGPSDAAWGAEGEVFPVD